MVHSALWSCKCQRWPVHWHLLLSNQILFVKSRRMEALFSIRLADLMRMVRWTVFIRSPHRAQRGFDMSISAQWADPPLSKTDWTGAESPPGRSLRPCLDSQVEGSKNVRLSCDGYIYTSMGKHHKAPQSILMQAIAAQLVLKQVVRRQCIATSPNSSLWSAILKRIGLQCNRDLDTSESTLTVFFTRNICSEPFRGLSVYFDHIVSLMVTCLQKFRHVVYSIV